MMTRRRFLLLAAAVLAAGMLWAGGMAFVLWRDRSYFTTPPYRRTGGAAARVLVVCYSRSGHTMAMAKEIALHFDADLLGIEARAYSLDFDGWRAANRDAWNRLPATIAPESVDLGRYDLVFLGSPVWWFRPAPPLWAFAEKADLAGKAVVLFNTFNSRFEAEEIAAFRALVEERGGRLLDHVFVKRGRVFNQITGQGLVGEVRRILKAKAQTWRG